MAANFVSIHCQFDGINNQMMSFEVRLRRMKEWDEEIVESRDLDTLLKCLFEEVRKRMEQFLDELGSEVLI